MRVHSGRGRITAALVILLGTLQASCRLGVGKNVDYSTRPAAVAPLGTKVADASVRFAETFCAVLPHTGSWDPCKTYLDAEVGPQSPASSPIELPLKVMIVGGAFSECFETPGIHIFGPDIAHLKEHGVAFGPRVPIGGTETPEENGRRIAEYLRAYPGDYLAIGHSKGAVDLMTALQNHAIARQRIKALVSVAGAIGGTRLSDLGSTLGVFGFSQALRRAGLGSCRIVDKGGIASLKRSVRYQAMRAWRPPAGLRAYSLVAASTLERTSRPLHTMWKANRLYSIDQDSHIVAEEAVIPGSEYLGVAKGDHWAVALPMSDHPKTKKKVNWNRFPRTALLEAIVRHVAAGVQ
jgi:hypothetical protein